MSTGIWRVVNCLTALRVELNAAFPQRSKVSDGTIGDTAHQNSVSDHNPRLVRSLGSTPVVLAFDATHDPASGADMGTISEHLRASRDPRITYVIFNRRIFSATVEPWAWRRYTGTSPHTEHMHVSVVAAPRADDTSPWQIGEDDMAGEGPEILQRLSELQTCTIDISPDRVGGRNAVTYWLRLLGLGENGVGMPQLLAAIKANEAAAAVRDQAMLAAIQALAAGGGTDAASVVAAVNAVGEESRAQLQALHTENQVLRARLAELESALHQRGDDAALTGV